MKALDALEIIRFGTFQRYFSATPSSLVAVFGLFEFMHHFFDLALACEGDPSRSWALEWYQKQLSLAQQGQLMIHPAMRSYLNRTYPFKRKQKKILAEAKEEYLYILRESNVLTIIQNMLDTVEENKYE